MDSAAVLLNDSVKSQFTYAFQLPLLKVALQELQEYMELNNIPATNDESRIYIITANPLVKDIGGPTGQPLPNNLVDVIGVWERLSGTTDDFTELDKMEYLPKYEVLTECLMYYAWNKDIIQFLGANTDRDVKIDYIGSIVPLVPTENTVIPIINAATFLQYRTAALCAEFMGENKTRADSCNSNATIALDRFLGIPTKGRQATVTRRRPFRSRWKMRGW